MKTASRAKDLDGAPRTRRWAGWLIPAILAILGASGPEVVKVRVPASEVASWFPPGSRLHALPTDRFEALLRSARDRPAPGPGPRLLRARHSARWESGQLVGRTGLTIEPSTGTGPSLVLLEPWSPSADGPGAGASWLRATADGRLAVKVASTGPSDVEFGWRLRARPGSDGRAFAPALPDLDVSSLVLDLPIGVVPEANAGPRIGPEPGPSPGRSTWRFEAARGRIDLRLRDPSRDAPPAGSPRLWLEGPTRVDLGHAQANWRADWTLDESPGAPRLLTIEFDPGLEPLDVSGPRVASFRVDAVGPSSRVAIRLDGGGWGSSPLTIRALCHAPGEGSWAVPAARPLDATWTGGRTTVRLDESRVLQACRELAGRRVAPRAGESVDGPALIFEPNGEAGPVAELTFRRPTADETVDVRGHLRLGDEAPRIEVALTWKSGRDRVLSRSVDLPAGWTPDRVLSASGQHVAWHADRLPNGGTRVHVSPTHEVDDDRPFTLTLGASALEAGVTGPLDLPRVRPSPGPRVVDEVWAATTGPNLDLRPILGRGLAWVDPPAPPLDDVPTPWVAEDLRNALAWRWLAEDAEARIDRERPPDHPRGEVKMDASIASGRLQLRWTLAVDSPRRDLRSVPIHLDEPVEGPIRWRSRAAGGPTIEVRPVDATRRASLGFPPTGSAFELELSAPSRGRIELEGQSERPWPGSGRLPLLRLPDRFRTRGLVGVTVEDRTRVKFDSLGLTPIHPADSTRDASERDDDPESGSGPRTRRAGTFGYRSAGGRLRVETTRGEVEPEGGLIREAFLVSQVFPGVGIRHRLTLKIAVDTARWIELRMPSGSPVDRVRRDGQPVIPGASGGPFRVEIPEPIAGRTSCTLTIDYRTPADDRSRRLEPARLLPRCSMPCLSFAWEVVAPEPWAIGEVAPGLVETDPRPSRSATSKILGFHSFPWSRPDREPPASTREAMLLDLDKAAADIPGGETNLGDWLLKLDAGRWPIVVDRLALRSSGWGPGSRINPASPESKSLGALRSILQPMGLAAIPLDGLILITARSEVPDRPTDRDAWSSRLVEVPGSGSDATDRFQSAARWRGEATPRAPSAGELPDRSTGLGGWHSWRVVSAGWPEPGVSATLVDTRADRALGWLLTLAVLALGFLGRGRSARARAIGLASIAALASLGLAWTWPEPSTAWSGLVRGTLAVLAVWLGRSLRPPIVEPPARPGDPSTTRRSGFAAGVVTASLVMAWLGFGPMRSPASAQADGPILALLPFEGAPDRASKPDRVVLLLDDFERLRRLAGPDEPRLPRLVSLQAAGHRVVREAPGLASVESRYDVEVVGDAPGSWSLPVGSALDLSATVDDRPVPLRIAGDGKTATVAIGGEGTHRLTFRRSVPLATIGRGGERLTAPINRAAFARVAVAKGSRGHWVEVPGASGALEVNVDGIEGGLGPTDLLDVRWFPENRPTASAPRGPIDAAFLWDARPVGDSIRLKLTHSDPDGASTIRIALEPGLLVRRYAIPDVVDVRVEGTSERPEWVAHVDPPLPKDVPIEVALWRSTPPRAVDRRWPSIEIATDGRLSAVLGFRRPGDWSGRLEPRGGIEAVSEASFARSWGPWPDDGMALAGAVRLGPPTPLGVSTRPLPPRRTVRPRVLVDLVPGRLNVVVEAVLADHQGRSFELEMGLPTDLRVTRVEAIGLLDWQRVARDRLRLQFDGSEAADRSIRVEGHLPAPADPVMTETRGYEAKVPWPRWLDAEVAPGRFIISSPTLFRVDVGEGVIALPTLGPSESDPKRRATFEGDGPPGPSTIRWSALPSRVGVSIRSDLTIDPAGLTWTAAIDCEITGGPADALHWNLPTEWADGATLEIEGVGHRLVAERKGAKGEVTLWTILPESPIWGRARMVLRSSRPLKPGDSFHYPELSPLAAAGRGSVDRYDLAIANVSGRPLEVSGSPGLQPVDVSKFRGDESPSPPGSIDRAYHVTGDRWWLRLRVGGPGDARGGEATRVSLAQVACSLREDGELFGRARYDLEPRPGPFLAVQLVESAAILWASVDGAIEPVLRDGPGRWLVPLGDRHARRVIFYWRAPRTGPPSGKPEALACPALAQADVPTLIAITAPDSVEVAPSSNEAERLDRAVWGAEVAEQLARKVVDALPDLDRSSVRDREQVLDDLIEVELKARGLSRGPVPSKASARLAPGRLQAALTSVVEAGQGNGLEDLIEEARARIGLAQEYEDSTDAPRPESVEPVRIRQIGHTSFYRAGKGRVAPSVPIAWSRKPTPSNSPEAWLVATIGLLVTVAIGRWTARPWRPGRRSTMALLLPIAILLMIWEPLAASVAWVLVGLGRAAG